MSFDPNGQPQYNPQPGNFPPPGSYPAQPEYEQPEPVANPEHEAAPRTSPGLDSKGRVRTSRFSALWIGLIVAAVLLILLLVFIAQNSQRVTVHYLGLNGHVSLAIALLLSAVAGLLLIAVPGTARILQLRRALKKSAAIRK
jgi:uncharacterized integral membrane protein